MFGLRHSADCTIGEYMEVGHHGTIWDKLRQAGSKGGVLPKYRSIFALVITADGDDTEEDAFRRRMWQQKKKKRGRRL